ncbi:MULTISPECIES: xanthine dehydrogenase accessory protein XdhC [Mesorhizobium]|uniref:Xanthine dehydrogenase accessory protein XdhC n=1 Tax=Mesorhizobium denitrificans TaxID=2294114 RepID=A0A371XCI7_9HYPH|nr:MULTISPECIES: xanthine dehydrogenase accessory protein XdhC [Mesorhizobium]RFC66949.1 xanthine dehydrogenase accessory protein XdhC [Mesorhizobium denitrificans]
MASLVKDLSEFLERVSDAALVQVTSAKGSTPREAGTWMLVARDAIFGTIGGGQLEYMAIDKARELLALDGEAVMLDVPLGPEIGQCCGGRVGLSVSRMDATMREELQAQLAREDAALPHIYVFGGGHVGRALAAALSLLPVKTIVVETRAEEIKGLPKTIETRLTPMPEEAVRDAPAGSAFLVLTHDHALDFLIVAEALKRTDAAYVGMIGSKTKKATFRSWYLRTAGGTEAAFSQLVSPIGGDSVKDKRPAVIAALAAAEVMTALSLSPAADAIPGTRDSYPVTASKR